MTGPAGPAATPTDEAAAALERARAAFVEGVAAFGRGDLAAAEAAFEEALRWAPGRPSVLTNLGVTRLHRGRPADALAPLQTSLRADVAQPDAWHALASATQALGRWDESADAWAQVLARGSADPTARLERAVCLARAGRLPQAVEAYRAWLAESPEDGEGWSALGSLLRELGRLPEAAHAFERALAAGADAELNRYYLTAVTPGAPLAPPPRRYVQALFDDYAADFDQHLVGTLGYQGHSTLVQGLPAEVPAMLDHALDLGCGTGLCGPLLRGRARRLTGVDLAPAMVEAARRRGVYDTLVAADLVEHLRADPTPVDLAVAADVFIYVGPLDAVFEALGVRVPPGGWLAFTVEDGPPGSGVALQPSLRYTHAADHLQALAARYGWRVAGEREAPIRRDQQQPVMGRYWYWQRRTAGA